MPETRLVYVCGSLEVEPSRREIRVAGVPAGLGDRTFEILVTLIEAAGRLVTKDELMQRVWAGAIVEGNTLDVHMSALRRALGPERGLLKTAYGRGYRLLGGWASVTGEGRSAPLAAPPPDEAGSRRSNLPLAGTVLIGRDRAVGTLCDLLSSSRLVTLIGVGGIGKTRLALEVAHRLAPRFPGDVWFIDLASLADAGLVAPTVARVLGLRSDDDGPAEQAVARAIGDQGNLIVLDNCEHVIDAAADLADSILRLCPRTVLLATSREAMRIDGEQTYQVPALEIAAPETSDPARLLASSAMALFVTQVRAQNSGFLLKEGDLVAVGEICRHLDGIPLAIEFAAARAAAIGIDQVAQGLSDRFGLLTVGKRNALPRQRTLRATLDWSYDLLPEEEASTLRSLAVFAGDFTIEAALAVAAESSRQPVLDSITNLVAKSLLLSEQRDGGPRFRLLETVRFYALEKLGPGRSEAAGRHARYFLQLLAGAGSDGRNRAQVDWLAIYGPHLNNLRAALDWAFSPLGDAATGLALTAEALPLWLKLSLMNECLGRIEQALASVTAVTDPATEMRLRAGLAVALFYTRKGAVAEVGDAWRRVLALAERIGDNEHRLWARWGLWNYQLNHGLYREALASARHFRELAIEPTDEAAGERMAGVSHYYLGEQTQARAHLERVLDYRGGHAGGSMLRVQYDPRLAAASYLSPVLWLQGFPDQAMRVADGVIQETRESGQGLAFALALVQAGCPVALWTGDLTAAEDFVGTLTETAASNGLGFWLAESRCFEAVLRITRGDVEGGMEVFDHAVRQLRDFSATMNVTGYETAMAGALAEAGADAAGMSMVREALARTEREEDHRCTPELLRLEGEFLLRKGAESEAEDRFRAALAAARGQQALSWELRSATSLASLLLGQGHPGRARDLLAPVYRRFTEGFETVDLLRAKLILDGIG